MKKYTWIIYFFILLPSCIGIKNQNSVEIDLSKTVPSIKYSTFVKNIEYVDLHLNDSLPIYGVENLYLDENKIFIKDRKSEGILIFDAITGKLLKRINQYKEGPEEIKIIGAFCLDTYNKQLCIFDKGDMKIKLYDYSGDYISSYVVSDFFIDMAKLDKNSMTYFYPIYTDNEQKEGIWTLNSLDKTVIHLDSSITENCRLHYFPMLYNNNGSMVYYYDRNRDKLSLVTFDKMENMYSFDIRQRIPIEKMGLKDITPQILDGYSILHNFACSENYLLLSFQTFDKQNIAKKNIKWVLLDRKTEEIIISEHLDNDMAQEVIDNHLLFYLDDHTWIKVDDMTNDYLIRLQLLHLK